MKSLSVAEARRCEDAVGKRCKCRCGGALHGANRAKNLEDLHALPDDDPHHINARQLAKALRDERKEQRRRQYEQARREWEDSAHHYDPRRNDD